MAPRSSEAFEQMRTSSTKKIMLAAFDLFGERGYKHTSISAIAYKAGISKGLVYNYFESKEAILKAVITEHLAVGDHIYNEGMSAKSSEETLKHWIDSTFAFIKQSPALNRVLITLSIETHDVQFIRDTAKLKTSLWVDEFDRIFTELNYPDPRGEAIALAAMLDGISLQYSTFPALIDIDALHQYLIQKYQLEPHTSSL